ncbi:MAG TPA: DUF4440 domain-containing protein [Gemmatimonadaceae bacterium]|nr:DUF4440 domain-containing protein [Gemmatimonadaceae bacterium]
MFRHRRSVLVALSALGLTGCQQALRPLADSDRNAIRAAVATFDKAIVDRDWKRIASLYTADGMILPPNGPAVQGRPAIERFFSGFPVVTTFRQEVVETEGVGNLAYAMATSETGKVITIWRKQPDNSWLVVRGMWNSDTPMRR